MPQIATDPDPELARAILDVCPAGIVAVDQGGKIMLASAECERMFGFERDQLAGRQVETLVPISLRDAHPARRAEYMLDPRQRLMGSGRDLRARRADGTEFPVEIGLNPFPTRNGLWVVATIVDISARQLGLQALRESEERFRALMDGVQDYAIFMLDPTGCVMSWNAGAERIVGFDSREILGQHYMVVFPEPDRASGRPAADLMRARWFGKLEEESWRLRKDGSRFLASCTVNTLYDKCGEPRGFAVVVRDVTAQHELEEQLRQAQKMQAVGTLAGGIAHDFNNILLGIVGYTQLAFADPGLRSTTRTDLGFVLQAADRGRELVQRILAFGRQQERQLVMVDLPHCVREAIALLQSTLPRSIEIRETLDPATPVVMSSEIEIQQVLLNLASNAAHAIGTRTGTIEIQVAPVELSVGFVRTRPDLRTGTFTRLRVRDNGQGMPEEVCRRALEPFYTTKPPGQGTGLGLSVVHGIVKAHGGAIEIESRVGSGTTVDIYLPAAFNEGDLPLEPAHGTGPHVLLVEDEGFLAALQRCRLEGLGYRVTMHTSSIRALEDFRQRRGEFDVVVTDNTMPQISGIELASLLREIQPDLPILLVSGMIDHVEPDPLQVRAIDALLGKPHTLEQLDQALSRLLDAKRRQADGASTPANPADGQGGSAKA
jgi:PAS domain S-box-containing protein